MQLADYGAEHTGGTDSKAPESPRDHRSTFTQSITVITPTRNRAGFWPSIERCMSRQTLRWNQWIVANDGSQPYVYTLGQQVIRPLTRPKMSFYDNLVAALKAACYQTVLFVEDDAWISPSFIERMVAGLRGRQMFGVLPVRSYNIKHRWLIERRGGNWTNLWQTAITADLIPVIVKELAPGAGGESVVWKADARKQIVHDVAPPMQVAFKAVPGERGTFHYHWAAKLGQPDPDLSILRKLIGEEDLSAYRKWLPQVSAPTTEAKAPRCAAP